MQSLHGVWKAERAESFNDPYFSSSLYTSYSLDGIESSIFDVFPLYLVQLFCIFERNEGRRKDVSVQHGSLCILCFGLQR